MKKLLYFLGIFVFGTEGFGQVTNVKAGLWSDRTVWSTNSLPAGTDDIVLSFDIVVDIDAICQSLTLNGHKVTVNTNVHLNISGDANTTLLSKYIEFDTTLTAPYDTSSKMLFHYDNAKRNTGIDIIYYDEGHESTYQFKSTFFYNGNDTLPFKKIVTTPFLTNTDEDFYNVTCFYFYTGSLLTMDSIINSSVSNQSTVINKYAYFSGGIINTVTEYYYSPVSTNSWIDTLYITYTNGNITQQIDSSKSVAAQNFQFIYDNHPNPFYRTQSKITVDNRFPFYSMETFIGEVFAKNNALEINETQNYDNYHYKNQYEYNLNGYPKIVRLTDQNDPTYSYKAFYYYTN